MHGKIYRREELDRALPLVGSIVGDIMRCHLHIRDEVCRLGLGPGTEPPNEDSLLRALSWEARDLLDELKGHVAELGELGIFLRDPAAGLVEAYGENGGEIVYFTWKFGEDRVRFWHGLFGSHRERLPVASLV